MQTKRRVVIIAVLSLPVVALLAWWEMVQLDLRRIPEPRWDVPAKGSICWGDSNLPGARPGDPPPELSEIPPGIVSPGRAALVAQYVIRKYAGGQAMPNDLLYGEGPTLVRATFPDGASRLAWRRISLLSEADDGMSGIAAAVYLEAATGKPLAVVRGISVCEPSWSPLFGPGGSPHFLTVWLQTSGQFVLLAIYAALVLFIAGVVFSVRWLRSKRRRPA